MDWRRLWERVRRPSVWLTAAALAFVAAGALIAAGRELLEHGTYGYWETAGAGYQATHDVFE